MLMKLSKITHWYLTLTYNRFHMNPSLIEKRKWNSYPKKHLKHLKCTRLFLIKGGGNCDKKLPWNCSRLEPLRFYGLIVFVPKTIQVCLVKSVLVFCIVLQCFLCYFYFIKQHFIKDNKEKKKPRPQKRNQSLLPSKDMPKISPETRTSNFN